MGKMFSLEFAGREKELRKLYAFVVKPEGGAFFIKGSPGIGKSRLSQKFAENAISDYDGWIFPFEVDDQKRLSELFPVWIGEIATFNKLPLLLKTKWKEITGKLFVPGALIGEAASKAEESRKVFHHFLQNVSKELTITGRAIIIVDAHKYLSNENSNFSDLVYVIKNLPPKIKLIVCLRLDDPFLIDNQYLPEIHYEEMEVHYLDDQASRKIAEEISSKYSLSSEITTQLIDNCKGWPFSFDSYNRALSGEKDPKTVFKNLPKKLIDRLKWMYKETDDTGKKILDALAVILSPARYALIAKAADVSIDAVSRALQNPAMLRCIDITTGSDGKNRAKLFHAQFQEYIAGCWTQNDCPEKAGQILFRIFDFYEPHLKSENPTSEAKEALIEMPRYLMLLHDKKPFMEFVATFGEKKWGWGLWESCLQDFDEAARFAAEAKDEKRLAIFIGNKGILLTELGDLENGLSCLQMAYALDEKNNNKEGLARHLGNMGEVYRIRGNLNEALTHYQKAYEINKKIGNKRGMATNYGNMGNVFLIQGDLDQALANYEKAYKINKEIENKRGMANNLGNMGIIYSHQGEVVKALAHYQKAYEFFNDIDNKQGMARQLGNKAFIFEDQGDFTKAKQCAEQALALFIDLGAKLEIEKTKNNLALLQEKIDAQGKS